MLAKLRNNIRYFFRDITQLALRRRQKKIAELEKRGREERRTLVDKLISKFDAAHADCGRSQKGSAVVELSLQEIMFIELNLRTWARTIRESEIYEGSPRSRDETR